MYLKKKTEQQFYIKKFKSIHLLSTKVMKKCVLRSQLFIRLYLAPN